MHAKGCGCLPCLSGVVSGSSPASGHTKPADGGGVCPPSEDDVSTKDSLRLGGRGSSYSDFQDGWVSSIRPRAVFDYQPWPTQPIPDGVSDWGSAAGWGIVRQTDNQCHGQIKKHHYFKYAQCQISTTVSRGRIEGFDYHPVVRRVNCGRSQPVALQRTGGSGARQPLPAPTHAAASRGSPAGPGPWQRGRGSRVRGWRQADRSLQNVPYQKPNRTN